MRLSGRLSKVMTFKSSIQRYNTFVPLIDSKGLQVFFRERKLSGLLWPSDLLSREKNFRCFADRNLQVFLWAKETFRPSIECDDLRVKSLIDKSLIEGPTLDRSSLTRNTGLI